VSERASLRKATNLRTNLNLKERTSLSTTTTHTSLHPLPSLLPLSHTMFEDDVYRTSSQFRLWSFTTSSLQSIRANTNALASERVRCAIRRAREQRLQSSAPGSNAGTPNPGEEEREREIECLTPDEELELVRYYCEKTHELGDEYKPVLPTMVRVCPYLSLPLALYS
jgi:hypothetical protein